MSFLSRRFAWFLWVLIGAAACEVHAGMLDEADGLWLKFAMDEEMSRGWHVAVGEFYSIEFEKGNQGIASIRRSRVVLESPWEDIEYYWAASRRWDNASLRKLLIAVNAKVAEKGLEPAVGTRLKGQTSTSIASKSAGVLVWGRDGRFDWRTLQLDSELAHEVRVLFERYIGGVAYGSDSLRDERVFVFEGSSTEGEEVDIQDFKKDMIGWSGRRVIVEGEVQRLPDLIRLAKDSRVYVGVDAPSDKFAGIRDGARVRVHGNFVQRGERDEMGYICRITSIELIEK